MSGDRGAAEPARYALLGLLLAKPSHGYDLGRAFTPDAALGNVITISASQLYALLARLEGDGLIAGEQQDAGARPQRRVYELTAHGREAVLEWVEGPVRNPRGMRLEFPVKLYIAQRLSPERALSLIARQREALIGYIDRLERLPVSGRTEEDTAFIDLLRAARIGRARAALAWLEEASERAGGVSCRSTRNRLT